LYEYFHKMYGNNRRKDGYLYFLLFFRKEFPVKQLSPPTTPPIKELAKIMIIQLVSAAGNMKTCPTLLANKCSFGKLKLSILTSHKMNTPANPLQKACFLEDEKKKLAVRQIGAMIHQGKKLCAIKQLTMMININMRLFFGNERNGLFNSFSVWLSLFIKIKGI